jgi:hypothetical protein
VIDKLGYAAAITYLEGDDPKCYLYIRKELAERYRAVYDAGGYTVYARQS